MIVAEMDGGAHGQGWEQDGRVGASYIVQRRVQVIMCKLLSAYTRLEASPVEGRQVREATNGQQEGRERRGGQADRGRQQLYYTIPDRLYLTTAVCSAMGCR